MPTLKEASLKRRRYAWMIKQLMEEKERAAEARIIELRSRQSSLKPTYNKYLELYQTHIKPLMNDVEEYWDNLNEIRKIEHFLQGQAEHRANEQDQAPRSGPVAPGGTTNRGVTITHLPYAGKSEVGHDANKKVREEKEAAAALAKIKAMNPKVFEELLKKIGGIR